MYVAGQNNNNMTQQMPIMAQPCCCTPQSQVATQQITNDCCQAATATSPATTIKANQTLPVPSVQNSYPAGYVSPQNMYPQYQASAQNVQIPASTSGVNIQIFNPSVGTPGSSATYNVNSPCCYPSGYYTSNLGPDGKIYPNGLTGQNGNNSGTNNGNMNTGSNTGIIGNGNNSNNTTNTSNTTTIDNTDKNKEKRKIVELTDDYIRNLEAYLDSQDKQVRLNAAKEVYARLEEDESRFDDKALTALINKMLQDPSREIRFLALTALDGRICKGDDYTVGVLKQMQQNNNDPLNQEAVDANSILLKMSARQVEKEFDKKETKDKKTNEISETFKPEGAKV